MGGFPCAHPPVTPSPPLRDGRIAEGLGAHAAAWDVYRDAPYQLEALAVPAWGDRDDDDTLRPEEAQRLLAIVRPHLDAR